MSTLAVTHDSGDRFTIRVRGHRVAVDQPHSAGGEDTAATPTELFVASLAACAAFYGRRFLARHDLAEGLEVTADFVMSQDRPARVAAIRLRVTTGAQLPFERRTAFERVLEHCTVHNSLRQPPAVDIVLDIAQAA